MQFNHRVELHFLYLTFVTTYINIYLCTKRNAMGKVKEPTATYYSRPMLNALRNHIKNRVEQMDDAELLSKISSMLDKDEESFEERYQRAKEFAYAHFDPKFAKELEEENFLIGKPMPCQYTNNEFEKELKLSEASGNATDEEVKAAFKLWMNLK